MLHSRRIDGGCGSGAMIDAVVDLSHHNAKPDFARLAAAGIKGVVYKASQGTAEIDPTYAAAEAEARAAGLWWGAYHFGTGGDGVLQARHFLDQVDDPAKTLLVLDFEQDPTGPSMSLIEARAFVTYVHAQTGQWPGLYSGDYVAGLLQDEPDPVLANCWFWLARYEATPVVPRCWPTWTMWQYTDGADRPGQPAPLPVPGIGLCDRDRFNGSLEQLALLWPH